jgi:tagatose 1,6-diphosphate aldolase GatY/KbaY
MLSSPIDLLDSAESGQYAIGGFNIYNLEGVNAVIQAAEEVNSPALLQIHPAALAHGGTGLIALCIQAAKSASVSIGVHLDHSTEKNDIQLALDAGIPSVMADGSHLAYDENVAVVRDAVTKAEAVGAIVEGELGRISGTEDGLTVESIDARMTDPTQASEFIEQTGIGLLAVCIGNIHGKYPFPPKLDFKRLSAIRDAVNVPLVLHGTSGLSEDLIKRSIELGIRKFNINTEVRQAYLTAIQEAVQADPKIDLVPLMTKAQSAMTTVIIEKMTLLESVGKTS